MSIEQMEYMLSLEKEKKISYAAKKCFISQPALSQQLAKIEKELGITLFSRVNYEYIPTAEGKLVLDCFQKILNIYHSTLRELAQVHTVSEKVITLAMPSIRAATLFTYIYSRFRYMFPEYQLKLSENYMSATPGLLIDRQIDFGLFSPFIKLPEHMQELFTYQMIADEELVLIASKNHPLSILAASNNYVLDIHQINGEDMVSYETTSLVRKNIDSYFQEHGIQCNIISTFKSVSTIIQFVKQNLAISIIPCMFAFGSPELAIIHLRPAITQEVGVLSLRHFKDTVIEEHVITLMKDAFATVASKL